jgi:hypothetical protein
MFAITVWTAIHVHTELPLVCILFNIALKKIQELTEMKLYTTNEIKYQSIQRW